MAKQFDYEVKTTIRLNMHNPDHVLINNVIQNLDPKIFKSKNQFILDACKFYIDNYGSETFIAMNYVSDWIDTLCIRYLINLDSAEIQQNFAGGVAPPDKVESEVDTT